MNTKSLAMAAVIAIAGADVATAGIIFSASDPERAASAAFDLLPGGKLQITLTNTSTLDVMDASHVLTALFFDLASPLPSLSRESAVLAAGSTVIYAGQPAGGVVGGEWQYLSGPTNATNTANATNVTRPNSGISSSGFGLFDFPNFPGENLGGPLSDSNGSKAPKKEPEEKAPLDGVQYGITSAGDRPDTGNTGITGDGLIKNSVLFTLGGLPEGFALSSISHVGFQYGTALNEPYLPSTDPSQAPAPGTLLLIGAGLLASRLASRPRVVRADAPMR